MTTNTPAKISEAGKKALEALVAQTQEEGQLPGFAIAVTNIDEQLFVGAGGDRLPGDASSGKVTPENVFWLCSVTKLITAVAALQLIEQGRLSVDDSVSKYIPQFNDVVVLEGDFFAKGPRPYQPAKNAITIAHLLSHSSGLTYFTSNPETPLTYALPPSSSLDHEATREATTEKFLKLLKEEYPGIPAIFEPGAAFNYGFSSDILGIVVEKVTGLGLGEYCKQNIFEPVGMKSTTFNLTKELHDRLVGLAFRNADESISPWGNQSKLQARYPDNVNLAFGGVGAYGTIPEYASFLQHLLRIEAGHGVANPILKTSTVKTLFQPHLGPVGSFAVDATLKGFLDPTITADGTNWSNAFALTTSDWPGRRKAGTGFWFGWAGLAYLIDPTTGIAIIVGNSVVPTMDARAVGLFNKVEEIVYANLV